ncbi:MAG: DUF3089 domain-containing protein [Oscillospiraceae bacterium]
MRTCAAFDYYLSTTTRAPIIVMGFSQGADMCCAFSRTALLTRR